MTRGRRALTIALLLVAVTACTNKTSNGPESLTTTATTTAPPIETATGETTQSPQQKPSITIANAPIGGSTNFYTDDDRDQCADVNWLGKPIPAGTVIRTGAQSLDPANVFSFQQNACGPDRRPCTNVEWRADDLRTCYVGVRQENNGEPVTLYLEAVAECKTQADCNSLVGDQRGSSITFGPIELSETTTTTTTPTTTSPTTTTPPTTTTTTTTTTDSPGGSAGG